jgi:D-alanyl-D-alanine carboxypeptidase
MFTSSALNNGTSTGYGYGWFIRKMGGSEVLEHGGLITGFSADVLRFPREGIFIAILTKTDSQDPDQESLAQKVAKVVLRH